MYNRQKAIEYAQKWALSRNPQYADFEDMGGDCTNFISQCLFAGGINFSYQNFGWYFHSLSKRAPSWTGVDELFSFATYNQHITGPRFLLTSMDKMQLGDIIQLKVDGIWTHSLIITKMYYPISPQNIYVCAHTFDVLNKPLSYYKFSEIRYLRIIN